MEQKVHTIVIKDLPKGEYAISVFQDEDFDKECNIGFLGFPKENYGFSNNYRPRFRAPLFDDCKLIIVNDTAIVIELK